MWPCLQQVHENDNVDPEAMKYYYLGDDRISTSTTTKVASCYHLSVCRESRKGKCIE